MRGTLVEGVWVHDGSNPVPPRYQRACQYQAFIPNPLTDFPSIDPHVAGTISVAEDAVRQLNSGAQPALQPLARLLLRSESIASSKVEGMQVDARTLARAEARSDQGEAIRPEAVEVLANITAMQLAVDEAAGVDELTLQHLIDTHRVLLERAVNGDRIAGVVRTRQNWIGGNDFNPCGANFVPPPHEYVQPLLDDLVRFANEETLPPLAQAAYAHPQFETIHPFEHGNGRTGRALVQMILRRRGLAPDYVPPISIVLAADKARYIEGLIAFRDGRESDWLQIFAAAAARAAELAAAFLAQVQQLQDQWRAQLAEHHVRSDAAAWAVIDVLPAHPIISVSLAVGASGRARAAIQQAVEVLVEAHVLRPLSNARRNRQWEAAGLLDLAAEFESVPGR